MPPRRAWTDDDTAALRQLHADGLSCRAAAAQLGFSPATVSRFAHRAGLTWDRAKTKAAAAAHKADLALMRARLTHEALVAAGEFLAARNKPFLVFNFGGKDNTYEERTIDRPPARDVYYLMQSFATAVGKSIELERVDGDASRDAKAMLAELGRALGIGQ